MLTTAGRCTVGEVRVEDRVEIPFGGTSGQAPSLTFARHRSLSSFRGFFYAGLYAGAMTFLFDFHLKTVQNQGYVKELAAFKRASVVLLGVKFCTDRDRNLWSPMFIQANQSHPITVRITKRMHDQNVCQ